MGRYYYGDIEGKFWFGIQSSDAADRFGVRGNEPQYLEYYFDTENLQDVQDELKRIEDGLGNLFAKLYAWYNNGVTTGHTEIKDYLGIDDEKEIRRLIAEYADWELGKKIEQQILENGECSFTAEL